MTAFDIVWLCGSVPSAVIAATYAARQAWREEGELTGAGVAFTGFAALIGFVGWWLLLALGALYGFFRAFAWLVRPRDIAARHKAGSIAEDIERLERELDWEMDR